MMDRSAAVGEVRAMAGGTWGAWGWYVWRVWRIGASGFRRSRLLRKRMLRLASRGFGNRQIAFVTDANVRDPERIYRYVRDELGGRWQQYTDHLESVTIRQWDRFLAGILDTWLADGDQGRVSVRNIDAAISYATTGRADQCIFADRCDGHVVVERNGDIYPCDFFVSPETCLGNIMESGWRELRENPKALSFAAKKCRRHHSRISQMDFYDRIAALQTL